MSTEVNQYADIMLEHMPVGVALYDASTFRLLCANSRFHAFIDTFLEPVWQGGNATGHPIQDWMPEPAIGRLLAIFRMVAETGNPYSSGEYPIDFPEHGMTYWNWTLAAVRDEQGNIAQLVHTAVEITSHVLARQRAEELQVSLHDAHQVVEAERQRLDVIETVARSVRESLETKHIGTIAIKAIKLAFNPIIVSIHIADAAQQALRLLHLEVNGNEQVANAFMQHIPYGESRLLSQAYRYHEPFIIENIQEEAKSGKIQAQQPAVLYHAQGFVCVPLWFKDYFEGALSATFDHIVSLDGPEVQTLVGCGTHIAAALAHARLHENVRNERVRLRAVLDQLPEGILITEAVNGVISYTNEAAARILSLPYKDLTGLPLLHFSQVHSVTGLNGQPALPWHFTIIRSLSGEIISGQETIVTRSDGSKIVTLTSSAPLYSDNGVISGAVVVFQDITIQRSIEQQKNEFLSIASHELRTPITAIQGFAEILQLQANSEKQLDGTGLRAIDIITEQSEHLTQLIEDMLDISRIGQAQLQLKPTIHNVLHLHILLSHVVESYAVSARQHEFLLHPADAQEVENLLCIYDEERLMQVFSNVLNNAIKYSPTGSTIEIGFQLHRQEQASCEAEIWVRDHGIGIAANELPLIFKRFYRASDLDQSFSGFGIGLYLVKEIIDRHGGRVWAESTEGQGSTFHITLPLT